MASSRARNDSSEFCLTFSARRSVPDIFDQIGCPRSWDHLQSNDTPARPFDLPATDDRVERPVSTLGEDIRSQFLNQLDRRVGTKADDPIYTTERRHELHSSTSRENGPITPFGTPNACIGVDCHDEPVAEVAGLFEASDVAYMEEVKTTVGEDDDLASGSSATDPSGQGGKARDLVSCKR